jgi:DNA polymerase elongation subunit (family B)
MKFYTNVAIQGSTVLVREVIDGIPNNRRVQWKPTLYGKGQQKGIQSPFKTLYGDDAYPIQPGSIVDCREFVKKYDGVDGFPIFGQLNYTLQFTNEYNSTAWDYSFLSSWSVDIETEVVEGADGNTEFPDPGTAKANVLLITMVNMITEQTFTFGVNGYTGKAKTSYMNCSSEKELFKQFINFWEQKRIDIITGWNVAQFDLPYLINRITSILGEDAVKRLSPWGRVSCREREFKGKREFAVEMLGVSVLDYIDLYKKYILTKQESYSLQHIAMVELGHTKLDHSQFKSWNEFHRTDWNLFTDYNCVDALLIKQLDDKLRLIELVLTVAYKANVNYEDVSSPVKVWDAIISNDCIKRDVVLPQQDRERSQILDGAYVKEPIPGWYKNVVSLDATSLYPSIIMTNNISPETWVGNCGLTIDDFLAGRPIDTSGNIVTPIGAVYRKDVRGILPKLVEEYMAMRKKAKTEMLRLEQELEEIHRELALIE